MISQFLTKSEDNNISSNNLKNAHLFTRDFENKIAASPMFHTASSYQHKGF